MKASSPSDASVASRVFSLRIVAAVDGSRVGEEFRVTSSADIGRDPACAIVLRDERVSRMHARAEPHDAGLRLVDLGSENGIWIGAERVAEAVVRVGQRFTIGTTVFECADKAAPTADPEPETKTVVLRRADLDLPRAAQAAAPSGFVIRVVNGGDVVPTGTRFVVDTPEASIGRGPDCTIVINERDVSRHAAKITAVAGGFLVTDLGGSAGVWLGSRRIESEVVPHRARIRLGVRIVIECDARPVIAPEPPAPSDADATMFISRAPKQPAAAPVAPLAAPAAAVVSAPAVSAPPPPASPAAPAADVPAPPAVAPDAAAARAESTDAAAVPRKLEDIGELVPLSAHAPFLATDANAVWVVVSGGVLLFTVAIEDGNPVGTRSHFLEIGVGQCFFGIDSQSFGMASGFLAVAKQGTTVRKIALDDLRAVAADTAQASAVATLVDTWVRGLSKALAEGLGPHERVGEKTLAPGDSLEIDSKVRVTSAGGVVWVELWSGSVLFNDMATPMFDRRKALFPVTPDSWLQPVTDDFGPMSIKPVLSVERVAGGDGVWYALDVFHRVLCECEFVAKRLGTVDEYVRLQQKKEARDAAGAAAINAIASVMRTQAGSPQEHLASTSAEPVFRACALVGHALGIAVQEHPNAEEARSYEDQVAAIASASGFRTRTVALRDNWFQEDHGSLLGQMVDGQQPIALIQSKPGIYDRVDPATGERVRVTAKNVEEVSPFAFSFYRPLPDGDITVKTIIGFGFHGMGPDLRWVLFMAVIVGMCGTVTPYFTGKIFDEAVPQADRGALVIYGSGMLAFAFSMAAFKFVQGVATMRIQTRMGSSIQSAVWDRIMNLPVNFFRQYSAGDLADRAEGIDAIQELISGAGVAAILGSISGLFYVGQMFGYDLSLALLAVVLTFTFVGVNMTANYLQLRFQRQEMQLRGQISGLVLNLLTGVSKLRICGSELHAFRVWAEKFATQRKISFSIGKIQSVASVFTTVFPTLSNLLIFYVMIGQQSKAAGARTMTTGDFIAFTSAYGLFMAAMQSLGDASLNMLRIVPIYERVKPIFDCTPEVDRSKAFPGQLQGSIELSHVKFRYDPDGPWIVNDLSLSIKAGEFVAFVGGSGCGKSTLMRLMLGFELPAGGTIAFDGQDLSQLDLRMVRQQMGVVLQVSRLMPTEIYRNIIGVSSKTIQDAWWAAERSGLAEDIKNMPMGMHTYVSEGGGTLSGGQRQRLMIARAIVNKPKILFLDEATSALDNRSQAIVTESMDKMDATRIVIAHRLSTIQNANKICYMDAGKIVEMGTYDELMKKDGLFAALAKRQVA